MTAQQNLAGALAEVQAKLPHVTKGKKADTGKYTYTYADLSDIAQAIHPLLGQVGLAWVTKPTLNADGAFVLAYSLRHTSGEHESGEYPLPDPTKTPPQSVGSAITYGRRYCLCAVTGVVADEDDDGAAAQNTKASRAKKAERGPIPAGQDEWQAPEGTTPPTPPENRVTDQKWFDGWLERVIACDSLPALKGLWSEASEQHRIGKLTNADFEQATDAKNTQKAAIERAAEAKGKRPGEWSDATTAPIPGAESAA